MNEIIALFIYELKFYTKYKKRKKEIKNSNKCSYFTMQYSLLEQHAFSFRMYCFVDFAQHCLYMES